MHQAAAAALLAAALLFAPAACGGGAEPPTPYFPSRQELDAQATAQAEHNRTVSATAKAMTRATVEASIGSEKTANARSTSPPSKTPRPTVAPQPAVTPTPAPPAPTGQTPPPAATPAATPAAPLNPAQYAGKLYDCLQSSQSAKAMFVQPALPKETADPRVLQEYETLTALTLKSRNSFVQSYSALIAENPAAGPILALAQSLCEALPDSR